MASLRFGPSCRAVRAASSWEVRVQAFSAVGVGAFSLRSWIGTLGLARPRPDTSLRAAPSFGGLGLEGRPSPRRRGRQRRNREDTHDVARAIDARIVQVRRRLPAADGSREERCRWNDVKPCAERASGGAPSWCAPGCSRQRSGS